MMVEIKNLKHLDLFSGIGGFALGFRNAGGIETVAFCEIEPYARRVLAKNFPGVYIYPDVKEVRGDELICRVGRIDIITAGFPCQDISAAGKQAGICGERSGLFYQAARIIGEVRPRFALLENVSALLSGGRGDWMGEVLAELAAVGYDCEWHCVSAAHLGAPHIRDRVWVLAYPCNGGFGRQPWRRTRLKPEDDDMGVEKNGILANADDARDRTSKSRVDNDGAAPFEDRVEPLAQPGRHSKVFPITKSLGGDRREHKQDTPTWDISKKARRGGGFSSDAASVGLSRQRTPRATVCQKPYIQKEAIDAFASRVKHEWGVEPDVGRVADGVPARVDRLRGLGNAIVPQMAEFWAEILKKELHG